MQHRWIESCALLGTFVLCVALTQGDWIERLLSPVVANQSDSTFEWAIGEVGPSSSAGLGAATQHKWRRPHFSASCTGLVR